MRIAIVVQGRFHAFDLARELIALGHDVRLLTNYPAGWPTRFGVPRANVRSLVSHGMASRAAGPMGRALGRAPIGEAFLHRWFSGWAAREIAAHPVDAIHCLSGVAEEIMAATPGSTGVRSVLRASSHIRVQRRILDEEERRAGVVADKPSDWMVAREEREYAAADLIVVLSEFARASFLSQGVPASKVIVWPYGVDAGLFRARPADIERRRARILSGRTLVVLTVGTFSLRKGAFDLAALAQDMRGVDFVFRGDIATDSASVRAAAADAITFRPRVAEDLLYADYREADLFYFPTLEDGYAAVLTQAASAGLPILATTNCGAADFLTEGQDGWILPIRRPDLAKDRLTWCDQHREALAEIALNAARPNSGRSWTARAAELVGVYDTFLANRASTGARPFPR